MIRLFRQKRIYLDYASAPPVRGEALRAMHDAEKYIGNPGAIHQEAVDAKRALERARGEIARLLAVKPREIIFTGGLTEANNIAILGTARMLDLPTGRQAARTNTPGLQGTHWIVSSIEHSSILECFAEIERLGGVVTHIDPDHRGVITPEVVALSLRKETVFVSIGWANNELGTIQPLREVRAVIAAHERAHGTRVTFHTDAGQAPLYLSTTAHSLGVDLLSLGSNKLYGPHGIGALYISNRAALARVGFGGNQERQLRPGTENVALAVGFAEAYIHVARERHQEGERVRALRDLLAERIAQSIPQSIVNGDRMLALPHMLNISIPGISSEYLTLALDAKGIALSTKSACREGEEAESHAVAALKGPDWAARTALRFSLGAETRQKEVLRVVHALETVLSSAAG